MIEERQNVLGNSKLSTFSHRHTSWFVRLVHPWECEILQMDWSETNSRWTRFGISLKPAPINITIEYVKISDLMPVWKRRWLQASSEIPVWYPASHIIFFRRSTQYARTLFNFCRQSNGGLDLSFHKFYQVLITLVGKFSILNES